MSCLFSVDWPGLIQNLKPTPESLKLSAVSSTAFGLIAAAEIGDKSQLVCMTLAARYRALPVIMGASVAFAVLNVLAVLFGVAAAEWLPKAVVDGAVIALFTAFGLSALRSKEALEESGDAFRKTGHGIFATTFLMIFAAEFGDKTQLAVAGLSATDPPIPVWLGSTLALVVTSTLGAWLGKAILQRMPLHWLHRGSGLMFLGFAGLTASRGFQAFDFSSWMDQARSVLSLLKISP